MGCGWIGGTVAVILARSGVEHFTLVEFDQYDLSDKVQDIVYCFLVQDIVYYRSLKIE